MIKKLIFSLQHHHIFLLIVKPLLPLEQPLHHQKASKRPKMSQRPYLRAFFAKPANLIFKYLSLKISLIQADCHWKQVLVVRSTRFHGLEQSLEILPERDSDLLASLDKGIVHCRSQCTLNTTKEQRALALYGLGTYRSFCCQVIYGIFTIISIGKDLLPKLMEM